MFAITAMIPPHPVICDVDLARHRACRSLRARAVQVRKEVRPFPPENSRMER